MNFKSFKPTLLGVIVSATLLSCGSSAIISTPIENIDNTPIKFNDLTDDQLKSWGHMDLVKDTVPGMSVKKAYDEIIKNRKGKTVIVAVIDTGIDTKHEDLDDVMWVNKKEIPNNGKDDDNNGYIDDIHGWNFLGTGYDEQLEYVRLIASGITNAPRYQEAKSLHEKEYGKALANKQQFDQIYPAVNGAHKTLTDHFKKENYTKDEVSAIKTDNAELKKAQQIANFMYQNGIEDMSEAVEELKNGLDHFTEQLNSNLNLDFKGRKTGDDPDDFSQVIYGNANVNPIKKDESHGTHVAGIIAAERNNGLGANGVANNVKIMALRAVSGGDEYDKDVALAIRYAVDNGAKIINGSFGKYYSPHSEKVKEALIYAGKNDVLFVHGAGNESLNIDETENFPNDHGSNGKEITDAFLSVGATDSKYGAEMVAAYSNYGKQNVDVFAPGSSIYSTFPENEYKSIGGTSMASPAVAGIAALIRSYYPKLKASQVKQIIMDSGLPLKPKVVVGGDSNNVKPFSDLSKSAKLVNAYNALILANKISKN